MSTSSALLPRNCSNFPTVSGTRESGKRRRVSTVLLLPIHSLSCTFGGIFTAISNLRSKYYLLTPYEIAVLGRFSRYIVIQLNGRLGLENWCPRDVHMYLCFLTFCFSFSQYSSGQRWVPTDHGFWFHKAHSKDGEDVYNVWNTKLSRT